MTNRIDVHLSKAKAQGKTALGFFVTVGFPEIAASADAAEAILDAGADFLELGVPFSDPLAEGPTVQMTSFKALQNGVTVEKCIGVVRDLRARGVEGPLTFMGYYNPYLHYGLERFVRESADAGVDGLIVPDLPTEEAEPFRSICDLHGLYLVPLLAPTSTDERIAEACKYARGFIYCVSVTGVTGARATLRSGIEGLVSSIRRHTDLPVMVGFGVSTRGHVEEIGRFADGAVIGSALLDAIDKASEGDAARTARDFVTGLMSPGDAQ